LLHGDDVLDGQMTAWLDDAMRQNAGAARRPRGRHAKASSVTLPPDQLGVPDTCSSHFQRNSVVRRGYGRIANQSKGEADMLKLRGVIFAFVPLTLIASLGAGSLAIAQQANVSDNSATSPPAAQSCKLAPGIEHVVEIQFDNVHLRRDNPNVPSDLEQMPNLLHFLEQGTLLTNHHTPLISHTADDIVTTLTGVYGEKHGQPVSNSYGYFRADGSGGLLQLLCVLDGYGA
jgi:hypothetical protein